MAAVLVEFEVYFALDMHVLYTFQSFESILMLCKLVFNIILQYPDEVHDL